MMMTIALFTSTTTPYRKIDLLIPNPDITGHQKYNRDQYEIMNYS